MKTIDQHIEEVGDWFDFNKVHQVMLHLNWKWGSGDVPEIADMRKLVRKYMNELHAKSALLSEYNASMGTGGFDIRYIKGVWDGKPFDRFDISFNLTTWDTESD